MCMRAATCVAACAGNVELLRRTGWQRPQSTHSWPPPTSRRAGLDPQHPPLTTHSRRRKRAAPLASFVEALHVEHLQQRRDLRFPLLRDAAWHAVPKVSRPAPRAHTSRRTEAAAGRRGQKASAAARGAGAPPSPAPWPCSRSRARRYPPGGPLWPRRTPCTTGAAPPLFGASAGERRSARGGCVSRRGTTSNSKSLRRLEGRTRLVLLLVLPLLPRHLELLLELLDVPLGLRAGRPSAPSVHALCVCS